MGKNKKRGRKVASIYETINPIPELEQQLF